MKETPVFDKLWDQLVPQSGKSESFAGEIIRAAGRLQYDFYNNGMGNNTSGAVNFLRNESIITEELWDTVHYYTTGRIYNGRYDNDKVHNSIDDIVIMATEFVMTNPQFMLLENNVDMFDFEDEEICFCDYCGVESDNYTCSSCEEEMEEEDEYCY